MYPNDRITYAVSYFIEGMRKIACCPSLVRVKVSTPVFQYELMETHISVKCPRHDYLAKYTFRQGHNSFDEDMIQYDDSGAILTADQFQRAYHEYMTSDRTAAIKEAKSVTLENGEHPIVVEFPFPSGPMYGLMLPEATAALWDL